MIGLSTMRFLDPQPPAMGECSYKSDGRPRGNGTNLSGVLYNLCSDPETKGALLQCIKALPEQDIKDIAFIESLGGQVRGPPIKPKKGHPKGNIQWFDLQEAP